MLRIAQDALFHLRRHGEETYPYECCGVLLGQMQNGAGEGANQAGGKTVTRAVRCTNTREDSPQNRYNIDPKELIRIQRESNERNEEIVGFYHSHPDHPAQWSQTDLAEAFWFGCSYLITSVEKGNAAQTNAFELAGTDESDKKFVDEKLDKY